MGFELLEQRVSIERNRPTPDELIEFRLVLPPRDVIRVVGMFGQ